MAILFSPITFIASIPLVTRGFIALTLILSPLTMWLRWKGVNDLPFLTFVPGGSWVYPYTFVASACVETTIIEVHGRFCVCQRLPCSQNLVSSSSL